MASELEAVAVLRSVQVEATVETQTRISVHSSSTPFQAVDSYRGLTKSASHRLEVFFIRSTLTATEGVNLFAGAQGATPRFLRRNLARDETLTCFAARWYALPRRTWPEFVTGAWRVAACSSKFEHISSLCTFKECLLSQVVAFSPNLLPMRAFSRPWTHRTVCVGDWGTSVYQTARWANRHARQSPDLLGQRCSPKRGKAESTMLT
ncbi:hypothetical protein IF2G_03151 [Cordyceps javanica]|nr:hypothetical protein IF2G_03151 [Cordyceps javanica]